MKEFFFYSWGIDVTDQEPDPSGLNFVFELGLKKIEEHERLVDALDLKMSILIAFFGAIITGVLAGVFTIDLAKMVQLTSIATRIILAFSLVCFTEYCRAGNVTFRPLPVRRSQIPKPISFRPESGPSWKCSSASASLPDSEKELSHGSGSPRVLRVSASSVAPCSRRGYCPQRGQGGPP